jgi:two-component system LytT family sensor kinase
MFLSKWSFWSFQLFGWSVFWLANNFFRGIEDSLTLKEVVITTAFTGTGILVTWIMRKVFLSKLIQKLETKLMFLCCLIVSLIAAVVMTGFSALFSLVYAWLANDKMPNLNLDFYMFNANSMVMILCIWSLLYFMIRYVRQYRVSEVERLRLATSLKDAQLNTLQGQINPHFMFNCLNNLRGLMLEDVNAAREGLSNLAEFLRYSLTSDQQDKVTLGQELAVVNEFVALAKIQYENKLVFKLDVIESCKACLMPIMALQMMTENAIKHGIAEQVHGGLLTISAKITSERLILQVVNPGQLVHNQTNYAPKQNSTGIGVNNIKKRLILLYGSHAHFSLEQQQSDVVAKLTLPLEYN